MNERIRAQYLEAMGIDSFVPRLVLLGAKESDLCEIPVQIASVEQTISQESSGVPVSASPTAINLDQILAPANEPVQADERNTQETKPKDRPHEISPDLESAAKVKAEVKSIADAISQAKPLEAPVRFSLSLWRVGNILQVIDSRRPGDALPTQSLLNNMLSALNLLPANLPNEEILNWPMVEGERDAGWSAASQMVHGFLEARLLNLPVPYMLLMGKDACMAMFGEDFDFASRLYQTEEVATFNAKAIVLPSLSDVLYEPHLKIELWLALKDLHQKLQTS